MPNNTSCSPSGTCVILTGTTTNGTDYVAQYDPKYPVPHWHQRMELVTIIVCNSLSLLVIVSRIYYRWSKLNRFRGDDRWMAFAGLILIPYTASQIGTNANGSGLYFQNVHKAWRALHWHYMVGWVGYYIVVTSIKLSVCCCFLQILSIHHKSLRYCVYGLCAIIASLGLTMTFSWIFPCTPVNSNFLWSVDSDSCINYDIFRYLWIGVSIPIDLAILSVPVQFLRRLNLRTHERRILKMVFGATLLGTITCTVGIYGAYETRTAEGNNGYYQETAFVMMCDIEILMYTLGASFPILSRYMVQKADPGRSPTHNNFSSWARYVPNPFRSDILPSQPHPNHRNQNNDHSRHDNTNDDDEAGLKSHTIEDSSTCITPDLPAKVCGSEDSGYAEGGELEKGVKVRAEVRDLREREG